MRIVVDLQGAQTGSRHRGIGRYSLAITKALLQIRAEDEILVVLNGMLDQSAASVVAEFDGLLPPENIHTWYAPGPVSWASHQNDKRRRAAELIRETYLNSLKPDIIFVTSVVEGAADDTVTTVKKYYSTPTVAVFYDLIPLQYPEDYLRDPSVDRWYREKLEHLKNADMLFAISASSAREAVELLEVREANVVNIGAATDERFRPILVTDDHRAELHRRFGITREFVLYTSATDERKNHLRLMEAYSTLPMEIRHTHQLVIAGFLPEQHALKFRLHATRQGLGQDELVITGRLTDEELVVLYNACKAFVFPSLHEGFGLPALEAMRCGTAVIASNSSSLPEVIGRPDALFDPWDSASIAAKIEEVVTDETFRSHLQSYGPIQSTRFNWSTSAELALGEIRKRQWPVFSGNCEATDGEGAPVHQRGCPPGMNPALGHLITTLAGDATRDDLPSLSSALAKSYPRRLLVDVSEIAKHDLGSGIQRTVKAMLSELLANPPTGYEIHPVYADKHHLGYRHAVRFWNQFRGSKFSEAQEQEVEAWYGDVFLGLDLQQFVVVAQKPILDRWHKRGVRISFMVYDILPVVMPEAFPHWAPAIHEEWLRTIIKYDSLICISRSVRDQVATWIGTHDEKQLERLNLAWIHLGADLSPTSAPESNSVRDMGSLLDWLRSRPSFLCVGTLEPRKGYPQLLQAFESLWEQEHEVNLIIVGSLGWKMDEFAEHLRAHQEQGRRLMWLESIDDDLLEIIYAVSACLVMASHGEGFGLPLAEAARHDLPIVSRDLAVFREVAGEHALYFPDSDEPEALAGTLRQWLTLKATASLPSSRQIPVLSWKRSAALLVEHLIESASASSTSLRGQASN